MWTRDSCFSRPWIGTFNSWSSFQRALPMSNGLHRKCTMQAFYWPLRLYLSVGLGLCYGSSVYLRCGGGHAWFYYSCVAARPVLCVGDIWPKPAHLATGWPIGVLGCFLSSLSPPPPPLNIFCWRGEGLIWVVSPSNHRAPGRLLRTILNRPNSLHCDGKAHWHQAAVYCLCPVCLSVDLNGAPGPNILQGGTNWVPTTTTHLPRRRNGTFLDGNVRSAHALDPFMAKAIFKLVKWNDEDMLGLVGFWHWPCLR